MKSIVVDQVLENEDGNLILVHEHWQEYEIDSIPDGFGFAQAHSINGQDACDGNTWVQLSEFSLDGWTQTAISVADYNSWHQDQLIAKRDEEIKSRIAAAAEHDAQHERQKEDRKSAEKKLKDLGITKDELKAILFS